MVAHDDGSLCPDVPIETLMALHQFSLLYTGPSQDYGYNVETLMETMMLMELTTMMHTMTTRPRHLSYFVFFLLLYYTYFYLLEHYLCASWFNTF